MALVEAQPRRVVLRRDVAGAQAKQIVDDSRLDELNVRITVEIGYALVAVTSLSFISVFTPAIAPAAIVVAEADFTHVSPQFSATFRATPRVRVYGTVAQGFKAGGFNELSVNNDNNLTFEPESTTSWELGTKTRLYEGIATANLTLFWQDVEDLQVFVVDPDAMLVSVRNAGKARSRGVELDSSWLATDWLTLIGTLGYVEAKRDVRTGRHYLIEPNIGRPTGRSAIAEAGGVELLLCTQFVLRDHEFHLFTRTPAILPTHNARVRRKFERILRSHLSMWPRSYRSFRHFLPMWLNYKLKVPQIIREQTEDEPAAASGEKRAATGTEVTTRTLRPPSTGIEPCQISSPVSSTMRRRSQS